jgi:hypothetical protein
LRYIGSQIFTLYISAGACRLTDKELQKFTILHNLLFIISHYLLIFTIVQERREVMKKGKNTAEILGSDVEFEDIEMLQDEDHERALILKAVPRSRRVQLIAQGAREMRCICCNQIRPLAGAEECEEGWVCEYCVPKAKEILLIS